MKQKLFGLFASLAAPLILTACNTLADKQREAESAERERAYTAERMAKGDAALAACIEIKCSTLDLDGMLISDFTVLNQLTHVTNLMVSRTNFDDISDISEMMQLKELHISKTAVDSLSGIENFTNLHLLHAQDLRAGARIDVSPIAALDGLTELALWRLNSVEDAAFVKDLPVLENLIVGWNGDEDNIAFLKDHKSLERLEIGGSLPEDQSVFLSIPNLQSIILYGWSGSRLDSKVAEALIARGVLMEEFIAVC